MGDLLELILEILGNIGGDWAFSGRARERSEEEIAKDAKWNILSIVIIIATFFVVGCYTVVIGLKGFFEKGETGGLFASAFGAALVVGLIWLGVKILKSRKH